MYFSKDRIRIRRLIIERNAVSWKINYIVLASSLGSRWKWLKEDFPRHLPENFMALAKVLWQMVNYPLDHVHIRLLDRETFKDLGY